MRETWLVDPLLRSLTSKFLDKTDSIYYGETEKTYTSEAQITIALTLEIGRFLLCFRSIVIALLTYGGSRTRRQSAEAAP